MILRVTHFATNYTVKSHRRQTIADIPSNADTNPTTAAAPPTDERNELRRRRHVLGDEQHEDGIGEEDGDAERHLLAGVRRQTEGQEAEDVEPDARQDDVEHIVEDAPVDEDGDGDVRVDGGTDRVDDRVALDLRADHRPLAVRDVVGHVDGVAALHDVHLRRTRIWTNDERTRTEECVSHAERETSVRRQFVQRK